MHSMLERFSFLHDAVKRLSAITYVPILVFAMAIMFARSLLAAKTLNVPEFGQYSIGLLISNSVAMLSCFGFYLILQRDLPVIYAKKSHRRGLVMLNQALFLAFLGFLILLPFSFIHIFDVSPFLFIVALLNGLGQQIFLVVALHSRSRGKSVQFANDNLIRSILIFFTIWLSASLTQSSSLTLLFEALVTIFISTWMYLALFKNSAIQSKAKVIWNISIKSLYKVKWVEALTLLGISIVGFAATNTDRWVAADNLSHDSYALYAFAGIILILAQSFQSVIGVSFFPYIAKLYGLESKNKAGRIALIFSLSSLIICLLLSIIAFPIINSGIESLFSKYKDAIPYVGFFLVIASFRASDFLSGFLIVDGRERRLLAINVLAILSGLGILIGSSAVLNLSIDVVVILWMALIASAVNFFGCIVLTIVSIKNLTS